jgi:O-antigen/teichoic acid export membrane protein
MLTASQVAFSLVVLPYVTRVLGPLNIGRVAFADNTAQYFIICASLGIPIYGVREVSRIKDNKEGLSKLFLELTSILLISTLLLLAVFFILILTVKDFKSEPLLFYLAMAQVFLSIFVFEWYYQGLENFKFIAMRTFFVRLAGTVAIMLFVNTRADAGLYYGIITLTLLGNTVLNLFSISGSISFNFRGLDLKRHLKPIFTFFSTRFVTSFYVIVLTIILGFVSGKVAVGYFSSAFRIYSVILTFIVAFSSVLIPRLSDYINRNMHVESLALISKSMQVIFSFGIPVVVAVICFSRYIILILLGGKFIAAQTDLVLLSPLVLIISISNLFAMNVLTPRNMEGQFLRATIFGLIVSAILMFFLLGRLNDVGAAITLFVTECVVCFFLGYYAFGYIRGMKLNIKAIMLNLMVSILIFGVAGYFAERIRLSFFFQFAIAGSLSGIIYLVTQIFFTKDATLRELFNNMKTRVLRKTG